MQDKAYLSKFRSTDDDLIFLYLDLFTLKHDGSNNHHVIDQYSEVIDTVENFVFANIEELVNIRVHQTTFKKVTAKIMKEVMKAEDDANY